MKKINKELSPGSDDEGKLPDRVYTIDDAVEEYGAALLIHAEILTIKSIIQAEDVVQAVWECLIGASNKRDYYTMSFLKTNAMRRHLDLLRKEARYVDTEIAKPSAADPAFTIHHDPKFHGEEDEDAKAQSAFWDKYFNIDLTDEQKEVVWLKGMHGYTFSKIEELIGVSSSTGHGWFQLSAKLFREERKKNPHLFFDGFEAVMPDGFDFASEIFTIPGLHRKKIEKITGRFFTTPEFLFWMGLKQAKNKAPGLMNFFKKT